MRSTLILGSGRSGTSMITGALAEAGYFMGDALHAARASNPRGFFEAPEVNGINEELLAPLLPEGCTLGQNQRWLGVPRAGAEPEAGPELAARMRRLLERQPFCFKDPRFSFTLPAWRPHLPGGAGLVCAFRHPALTAASLVGECAAAEYLAGVPFDLERAFALWIATYRAILERHAAEGDWLFVHYDQMLAPEGRARLSDFLGAQVSASFPDPKLRRRAAGTAAPAEALELYQELCARAGHAEPAAANAVEPRVTVLAWIGPGDERHVPALIEDAEAQRGVRAELCLIDGTDDGLEVPGARVQPGSWSRCADLRSAALAADTQWVALAVPGARSLPSRLAHALERLAAGDADLVTADCVLRDEHGRFVDRASPGAMGDVPGPWFEAGIVARRAAFEGLPAAAFFPGELSVFRRLRAAGRAVHVLEPGYSVERRAYAAAWDRAQDDAALVTLAGRPAAGSRPELSVSLCTYDRRRTLRLCLERLARQRVPPGTFEIVLTDDGSRDGTAERLAGLELMVPLVKVRQENGGLSSARNAGLAHARGALVLFVNDDTLAFPDLVEQHLARHAQLAEQPAAVLGTFEQPSEALRNALLSYLEGSTEIFAYSMLKPGENYDAFRFWTCNVSAPLAAVRAAGGYDESFRHYGCEDIDLGFRLEQGGLRVVFEPAARAYHQHVMDFEYVRRRARTVARAYVRLVRKHPALLARWSNESLTARACERELARGAVALRELEAAGRELARLDTGALRELAGSYAELADEIQERLSEVVPEINRLWWRQGFVDGLSEHGLSGFDELVAGGLEPWPIATRNPRVLCAWPRWDDPASLDRLLERAAPVAADGFAALLLRRDPARDPPHAQALAALQDAYARRFGSGGSLEVLLEEAPLGKAELLRLGRTVSALVPLGGEPAGFLAAVGAERLASPEAVAAWRARFEGAPGVARAAAPEERAPRGATLAASVIVPTHGRPRELVQLLDALAAQDLGAERFEVLVVDDGSPVAVAPLLERRTFPFDLKVLPQARSGPAAARNRALAHARGRLVVFFNDDAVPAADCLRRHLLSHAVSDEPRAVIGTFRLLQKHMRDSFAVHVETSTALFAQPRMRPGVRYHGLALCTGNASIKRDLLSAAGGFDESLPYAGGEDSELGLRLERQLGLRVVFDPRVQSGHDHALDAAGFAARRRVVGWTAYHVEERHSAGLVAVAGWDTFAAEVEEEAAEREELTRRIAEICAEEEMGERPRGKSPEVAAAAERLGELEFRYGALLARQGHPPRGGDHALERAPALAPAYGPARRGAGQPGGAGALLAGGPGAGVQEPLPAADAQPGSG